MNCWKCGKELENGIECPSCASEGLVGGETKGWAKIDWSKVEHIGDLIEILSGLDIRVDPTHPDYKRLRKYLKHE